MARILAVDYGLKRCGLATTDTLQLIANGLPTIPTTELMQYIKNFCKTEDVEKIIFGLPKQLNGESSDSESHIAGFIKRLRKELPDLQIERFDERFTSTIAHREMIAGGFRKNKRQQKGFADEIAAVLILTDYLESRR